MNITIVGPGAIGSLWAVKLIQAGHTVSLWSRSSEPTFEIAIDSDSPITFENNNINQLQKSDLVFFTVKAWQVESAVKPLLEHLHPDTILLFMHNGMGAVEAISNIVENHPIVLATTTHAAYKPNAQHVMHTGIGHTQLGAFNTAGQQCQFLTDVLDHTLPNVTWNANIEVALWNKLAINCAINPLTGLEQIKNGELADSKYKHQLDTITHELVQVMQAETIPCSFEQLRATIDEVIIATAKNNSSMKQDMYYNRKTEIDFITGYLIKVAHQHSITIPMNQELYQRVKQQENTWEKQ